MLKRIRSLFDELMATDGAEADEASKAVHCAAAALLMEIAYTDEVMAPIEQEAILKAVRDRFELTPEQADELLACAGEEREQATDYFQFTALINANFDAEKKAALIEELWRVAYADQVLCKHQEHLVRKVANLLHVPHSVLIAAKLRVEQ